MRQSREDSEIHQGVTKDGEREAERGGEEWGERGMEGGEVSIKKNRRGFTGPEDLGMGLRLGSGLPRAADPLSRCSGLACVSNHLLENVRLGAKS